MCWRHKQLRHVIGVGAQCATTNVRQKATVVCEVRGSQSTKRLMYESRDLEHNALTDWQPVQLPQHRCDVVTGHTDGRLCLPRLDESIGQRGDGGVVCDAAPCRP